MRTSKLQLAQDTIAGLERSNARLVEDNTTFIRNINELKTQLDTAELELVALRRKVAMFEGKVELLKEMLDER